MTCSIIYLPHIQFLDPGFIINYGRQNNTNICCGYRVEITVTCIVCLPRHFGDCLSQTPASLALLTRHTLNLSPCTRVKPALQVNVACELIFLPSVNLINPYAGAIKDGQVIAVNIKHTT